MIEFKIGTDVINWESLVQLYFEVDGVIGLGKEKDLITIKESFLNSYKVVTAWDRDQIIGAGRLISDGLCYGWVHDLGVLPDFRKKGIARKVMKELMNGDEDLLFGLTSSFEAVEFYYKLGFKKHKTALAKYPCESIFLED